ncbi:MAG TPA: DUF2461 domain-containing protein [Devosiaceae bacterium]
MAEFKGFPQITLDFLRGLAAHNEKAWFEAHRADYEAGYTGPAFAFIETMGPRLRTIAPDVQFAPRVNGSLWRINRDARFSKDKSPYKTHLGLWFWHGERRAWDQPGFYVQISPERVFFAVGMHNLQKPELERFRYAVQHKRAGNGLLAAVEKVRAAGPYTIGEKTRKKPPRGFEAEGERAEYLLYEGLIAMHELPAESALAEDFADTCFTHFSNMWPLGQWLMAEVAA